MTAAKDGADLEERARRAFEAACERDEAGDRDAAITLYRQAAMLGDIGAQLNLGNLLTEGGPESWFEGMRWYRRGVRSGNPAAASNLAMAYRLRGNRRRYFQWLRVAARMGDEDAEKFLRAIESIRARGGRAPMLFLNEVDGWAVLQILDKFLAGALTRDAVVSWAVLIATGEAAIGLPQGREVAQVIEELADPGRRLTKKRARELIFKLE